ncbi:DUF2875 family protein [Variovorax sp. dw_954]|uniref:type VI lipase adapter Tla3 domain-containing protein n=1 Tax=Variovorax sp. dw_954 TaxID=2720078 RepID=UPI001BD6D404|nr:DUF2875 family protein [Variovorax sp. dw_954]
MQLSSEVDKASSPDYMLEIIGMGVTLDKYRQGALWDVVKEGHPFATVREQDPRKYEWSDTDKLGVSGGRAYDALENGAKGIPDYWGVPSFYAGAPLEYREPRPWAGLVAGAGTIGMGGILFITAPWAQAERPDRLLEKVFTFFDEHPEVPYVVVSANDDMGLRDSNRPRGTPDLVRDGYYVLERPDATAVFVLARRERLDVLRPFAFEDINENDFDIDEINRRGFGRRLFLRYNELRRSVSVADWLKETAAFAQRPDIYPKGASALVNEVNPWSTRLPRDFKPTPWFPIPWSRYQFAAFDRLPTLGYLHRPVFVKMADAEGKPLTRRDEREAALAAGWQQALQTLPEGERKASPARVVTATGGNPEQTIELASLISGWTAKGGPEIDAAKPDRWINTDARLGNTGAATWFVQMAIGTMGSYLEGGASAAINMRDPGEASIVFVTPPPPDKRKAQQSSDGGNVFRSNVTPAIDPGNYKN